MASVGVKIDQFDVPVCNSFQAKILNDQLCYEVDLQKFSDANHIQEETKIGFSFLLDYNEDRQVTLDPDIKRQNFGLTNNFEGLDQDQQAFVHLDTIGKGNIMFNLGKSIFEIFSEPVVLIGEGMYNLDSLKEIKATDSYLGMDKDIIECQNKEPYFNCTTRQTIDTYLKSCGCLPFAMQLSTKEKLFLSFD